VHALSSLQEEPFDLLGFEQVPDDGSQVPATWHWSLAVHATGFTPVHAPDSHVSVCVQALPSSQPAPSERVGFEHDPDDGSQTPAMWHWSLAVHATAFAPVQVPD